MTTCFRCMDERWLRYSNGEDRPCDSCAPLVGDFADYRWVRDPSKDHITIEIDDDPPPAHDETFTRTPPGPPPWAAVGRVGVAAARASLACTVRHVTTDEQTVWYGTCPNCDLKPRFASLVAFEAWATHHHCNITKGTA